jgi:hypothetical protein
MRGYERLIDVRETQPAHTQTHTDTHTHTHTHTYAHIRLVDT